MPQAMGKEVEGYVEGAAQTHRSPQSPVRWHPQAQCQRDGKSCSWGGLRDARSLGVAWAAGNGHVDTTPLMAPRTPLPPAPISTWTSLSQLHPGYHDPISTQDITA